VSGGHLTYRTREPAGAPEGALVLFHGRGADELDLFSLFDALDPGRRLLGLSPRGPLTFPPGGAHWYVVRRVGFPDPDTFLPTFELVTNWLNMVTTETGISPEQMILGGFSQGAVMGYSLALGPNRPRPAGICAFSGFIPTIEGFDIDLSRAKGLPVAIGHGIYDPIITVDFGRDARSRLEAAGAEVTYRESEMPHAIHPEFVQELQGWLRELPSSMNNSS
jgi:phospholipase/carboxylesterase